MYQRPSGIAALALGGAVWAQLAALPALVHRGSSAVWAPALVALAALAESARVAARSPSRALALAAAVFPLCVGVEALAIGRAATTGSDPPSRVLAGVTATLYLGCVAQWHRLTREPAAAVVMALPPGPAARRAPPALRSAAVVVLAAVAFGLGVVAPAVIVPTAAAVGLRASRASVVLAGAVALSVGLVLGAGSALLRASPPRDRSAARALWFMAGAASGVIIWRLLSHGR